MRNKFMRQCNLTHHREACNIIVPQKGQSFKEMGESSGLKVYRESIFCLSPVGDNPARKATFDAINGGCIPVFLDPDSFIKQNKLHLTLEQKIQMSLTFHHKHLKDKGGIDLIDELKK